VLSKPPECSGCPLEDRGRGFVPAAGPINSPILLYGEAAGEDEVRSSLPFQGAAGSLLNRLLTRNHQQRDAFRVHNVLSCSPPGNWLVGAPWERSAITHCAVHRAPVLAEPHRVIVALGATALKTLTGLTEKVRVEDFHGCVVPVGDRFIVPTFHPSHLQRGAMNLFGVSSFDVQVALRVASAGYVQDDVSLVIDPPVDWFTRWVEQVEGACAQDPGGVGIAEDIETLDKASGQDEGELTPQDDQSYQITRINFSVHPDEGVTVPYGGPYVGLCERLFRLPCAHYLWNKEYDDPRLIAAGHTFAGDRYDGMWAAHRLQSDIPRGLGFWAPFYDQWGAWKHLARTKPGYYAACDGFKTYRTVTGVIRDLLQLGMWDAFARHTHATYQYALKPAQAVGVKIDRERLVVFIQDLAVKQRRLLHEMQGLVPDELRPLVPKTGLKRPPAAGAVHTKGRAETVRGAPKKDLPDPIKQELYAQVARVVSRTVDLGGEPITRYYWQEPFNPDSPEQILDYIKAKKHKPGRAKKTGHASSDREALEKLIRETRDPLYKAILDSRAVNKVRTTYGVGTLKLLDKDDRVHPVPTDRPSTGRRSYINPNITNVISRSGYGENLASGFRRCVTVEKGCRLLEVDFSAIESCLTGYFSRDPQYIRLARLGVHAALASHILGRPYDPAWSDQDIAAYFKAIKATEDVVYQRSKRLSHGKNYGLTTYGMVRNFPESFPTLKVARQYEVLYEAMAPALPQFHGDVRQIAHDLNYLGGAFPPSNPSNVVAKILARNPLLAVHPYGYKHHFFSVIAYRKIPYALYQNKLRKHEPVAEIAGQHFAVILGEDAKRCVAFFPQSTASGILTEAMLRLFTPGSPSYIGEAFFGKTPLRAPIHDALLLEVPIRVWDQVLERVAVEMTRPVPELSLAWIPAGERERLGLGSHLAIGISVKCGTNWAEMETITPPTTSSEVAADATKFPEESDVDQDEFAALGTSVA
jgi:uracil-DNA glycosylase family 4